MDQTTITLATAPPTEENQNQNQYSVINLDKNETKDSGVRSEQQHTNSAFTTDDLEVDYNTPSNFRRDRPGSTMSAVSSASKSSRSSVNCTSGILKCPSGRLTKFFSYKEGGLDKCMNDIKPIINGQIDGNILGNWLLIEIDHWDLHREKVVVLTEKAIIVVSYDFIKMKLRDFKRIMLNELKMVTYGNLKYPNNSMMGAYLYGAVKLSWGNEPSAVQKWNPFAHNIPYLILTSHHILYNEKENETALYNCDEFIASLELAISQLQVAQKPQFTESQIEIESYASLVSVLYNQNWLGFQLDRNGVNF